jgi:antitoxin VapB
VVTGARSNGITHVDRSAERRLGSIASLPPAANVKLGVIYAPRRTPVALNIKNDTVERLATEVADRHGITKTEAVRRALEAELERSAEPRAADRSAHLVAFLERDVWPFLPADVLGHAPSKAERERILGYGEDGV